MLSTHLAIVLIGWMLAGGSPGPATLAISGTAMGQGRRAALAISAGIVVGSALWGIAAALGMSAVMQANAWAFEIVRYLGAAYLLFLAAKSLRKAWLGGASLTPPSSQPQSTRLLFVKGMLLHLTNPKAILSWAAIYSIALGPNAGIAQVWTLFAALITCSMVVFFGYALLFAAAPIAAAYRRAQRGFELAFGLLFGAAALKVLTTRLG